MDNKANDYIADGQHPNDPRKRFYDTRIGSYGCVVDILGSLDDALDTAVSRGNRELQARSHN